MASRIVGGHLAQAALLILLSAPGMGITAPDPERAPARTADAFDPELAVVFPPERAQQLVVQCSRSFPKVDGTWVPTSTQIMQFEALLAPSLGAELMFDSNAASRETVADFYRQYAGLRVSGHHLIYANGFYRSHVQDVQSWLSAAHTEKELSSFAKESRGPDFWKGTAVDVCDGGRRYWAAAFDVDTGRLILFKHPDGVTHSVQFMDWDRGLAMTAHGRQRSDRMLLQIDAIRRSGCVVGMVACMCMLEGSVKTPGESFS